MRFTGLLLKESLKDLSALDLIHIERTEVWNVEDDADNPIWTAIFFGGDEDKNQIDLLAEKLSRALKPPKWYLDMSIEDTVTDNKYVVYPGKVFNYTKGDREAKEKAQDHGRSLGIPDKQLDWSE